MDGTAYFFDVVGLDELAADLRKVEKATPEIARAWLFQAGRVFLKDVRTQTRAVTKQRTKNLVRGYRQRLVLKHGSLTSYESNISGGNGKARHFHLVEKGHRGFVPTRGGMRSIGFVQGKKMMETTRNRWTGEMKIVAFAEKAIEEALKEGKLA